MSIMRTLFGLRDDESRVIEAEVVEERSYGVPEDHANAINDVGTQTWSSILDLKDMGWSSNAAGQPVNPRTAGTIPAIYNAVRRISEPLATCPLTLMQTDGETTKEAKDEELYWIMKEAPNEENTPIELIETWVRTAALRGDGILVKEQTTRGKVLGVNFIHPDRVRFSRRRGRLVYEISENYDSYGPSGIREAYFSDDVCHLRGPSNDAVCGISPIQQFVNVISEMLANYQYRGATLRNGGLVKGLVTTQNGVQLTEEQIDEYGARWREAVAGPTNAGKVAFLPGTDFKQIGLSPTDLALIQMYNLTIRDVALIFNVPLHWLMELQHATFSNVEHQGKEGVRDVIRPWARRTAQVADRDLLSDRQRRAGLFFKFNIDALAEGDSETQATVISKYISCGVYSVNEGRKLLDRNPVEGGDRHTQQMQNVDITANPMDQQDQVDNNAKKNKDGKKQDKKRTAIPPEIRAAFVGIIADSLEKIHKRTHAAIQNAAKRAQNLNDFHGALDAVLVNGNLLAADDNLRRPMWRVGDVLGVARATSGLNAYIHVKQYFDTLRDRFASCKSIDDVRVCAAEPSPDTHPVAAVLFEELEKLAEDSNDENTEADAA